MAIVSVLEQFTGREGSGDYKAVREYTRVFKVITAGLVEDAVAVSAAPGVPRIFDLYRGSDGLIDPLGALCTKVMPHCVGEFEWEVRCTYSNRCDWPDLGQLDPLLRPAEISWGFESGKRAGERDTKGKAYVNSANEKFRPPFEVDDDPQILTIKRNEQSFDPNLAQAYKNAVNSDSFYGWPAGHAQCKPIVGERHYENHIYYWAVTYVIRLRNPARQGWQPLILDQGFHTLAGGKPRVIYDPVTGAPYQSAQLLDGQGGLLSGATAAVAVAGITAAATDFVVAGTTPAWLAKAAFPITILIDSELISVTGKNPNVADHFTASRGYGGTTAAAHASGATIALQPVFLPFAEYPALPFAALRL